MGQLWKALKSERLDFRRLLYILVVREGHIISSLQVCSLSFPYLTSAFDINAVAKYHKAH